MLQNAFRHRSKYPLSTAQNVCCYASTWSAIRRGIRGEKPEKRPVVSRSRAPISAGSSDTLNHRSRESRPQPARREHAGSRGAPSRPPATRTGRPNQTRERDGHSDAFTDALQDLPPSRRGTGAPRSTGNSKASRFTARERGPKTDDTFKGRMRPSGSRRAIANPDNAGTPWSRGAPTKDFMERRPRVNEEQPRDRPQDAGNRRRNNVDRPLTQDPWYSSKKSEHHEKSPGFNGTEESTGVPDTALPFATAASQFIYGRSAVLACLRAGRRQVHKAYINKSRLDESGYGSIIRKWRKHRSVPIVEMTSAAEKRALDRIAVDRPHNGIVLDVSPLPFPPVLSLGMPRPAEAPSEPESSVATRITPFLHGPQSAEEKQANSSLTGLVTTATRQPFVLVLDGIKDEGNMGNIIRSAHFYGVDAIAVCSDATAPVNSAVVAKAASGAVEVMPLLKIDDPVRFLELSKKEGWEVWASVAPEHKAEDEATGRGRRGGKARYAAITSTEKLQSPLDSKPCILLLGSEGQGLRSFVTNAADKLVTINRGGRAQQAADVGVDSLNVSSAAAVLLEAFMRGLPRDQGLGPGPEPPREFKITKFTRDDVFD